VGLHCATGIGHSQHIAISLPNVLMGFVAVESEYHGD
jgi:hypothetical protein